jgi:hypothetical protein
LDGLHDFNGFIRFDDLDWMERINWVVDGMDEVDGWDEHNGLNGLY